jgi:death-on-curing protein
MKPPVFLTAEQIKKLHEMGLKRHGGASGLGDIGLFESAIMQPKNDFLYGKVDVFGISAAYAYHISQAQSFLDGNKRTAVSSALVFLELNGVDTSFDSHQLYLAMIAIAEKRMDKASLADLLRELCGG